MGRARGDALGGLRRPLHLTGAGRTRLVGTPPGRADDDHLVRVDGRRFGRHTGAVRADSCAVLVECRAAVE